MLSNGGSSGGSSSALSSSGQLDPGENINVPGHSSSAHGNDKDVRLQRQGKGSVGSVFGAASSSRRGAASTDAISSPSRQTTSSPLSGSSDHAERSTSAKNCSGNACLDANTNWSMNGRPPMFSSVYPRSKVCWQEVANASAAKQQEVANKTSAPPIKRHVADMISQAVVRAKKAQFLEEHFTDILQNFVRQAWDDAFEAVTQ